MTREKIIRIAENHFLLSPVSEQLDIKLAALPRTPEVMCVLIDFADEIIQSKLEEITACIEQKSDFHHERWERFADSYDNGASSAMDKLIEDLEELCKIKN